MNYQYLIIGLALIILIQLIINIRLLKSKKEIKKESNIKANQNTEKELDDLKTQLDCTIEELQKTNKKIKDTEIELKEKDNELKETKKELEKISNMKSINNIPDKEEFLQRAIIEFKRCKRENWPMTILIGSPDNLKKFNDEDNYECIEIILLKCANIITENMRPYDILAKWSEEEFIVLLPKTDLLAAQAVSERIRSTIEYSFISCENNPYKITISLGLACLNDTETMEQCIQRANIAMQKTRKRGTNQVSL